jgi:hypothetical protein
MNPDTIVPIAESPLDAFRGTGMNPPKKERKKPGRKKKASEPPTIDIIEKPITLYFN